MDDAPATQKAPRFITNDATAEALGQLMIENPNGILFEADELIGLLKNLDKQGQEGARAFYLTAADGNQSYTIDRIMRGTNLHIESACLSIIGGIQPGVLSEYVREALSGGAGADGLLQRFGLMVYPDISPVYQYIDRFPDKSARQAVNDLVRKLHSLDIEAIATIGEFCKTPYLQFDDAAQEIFIEWLCNLETRLRSGEDHPAIVSHLSKYRKLIPSLALINHLCDSNNPKVSESALLRALAYSEYLESHARRVYSHGTQPGIDAAKAVLAKLKAEKLSNPFSLRDVYKNHWAGIDTPKKAQSAIDMLLDYSHLTKEEILTDGRPTTSYHWVKVKL
jgi:putative DNA primase/helicase